MTSKARCKGDCGMNKAWSILGLVFGLCAVASGGPMEIEMAGANAVRLDWEAVPGKTYTVMATPDLVLPSWTNLTPGGISFSNVIASSTASVSGTKRFYRIYNPDLDPPTVSALVPISNAVAVATNATVYITLEDATGINTQSLALTIAGWTNMASSSPNLAWSNNTVIFTPTAALSIQGATVTNFLTITDTLGHTLSNYTWTFTLARAPEAAGEFLSLTAPPSSKRTATGRLRTLPNVRPKAGSPALHIKSVTSNTVVFSYVGSPPTITNGTRLVSFDAAYPFYRQVTSNTVDAGLSCITAWTMDISITNILMAGSLSTVDLTAADPAPTRRGIGVDANLLHVEFGDDLSGTILHTNTNLKLWLPECNWDLTADVDVAADIAWGVLQSFDASARSEMTIHIKPEALFYAATSGEDEFPLVEPVRKIFGGMIGPVPVWVEVIVELNAGYEYDASVSGNAHTVVDMGKELVFSVQLRQNQWSYGAENPPIVLEAKPIIWQLEGNAYAKIYVQPKLTVLAYSLAGLWADVVPYTELEGQYQFNPLQYDWALYFGLSSTLGIESRIWNTNAWGEKPEWTLYDERWPLWSTHYPSSSAAPVFSAPFPNRMVQTGGSLTLSGWASGIPEPHYRWYYNNSRIVGAINPEYSIAHASSGHAGTWSVQAYNGSGTIETSCNINVVSGNIPLGMVLIPGGINEGANPLAPNESYSSLYPESYSLAVDSFYMDKYETRKALWDEVRSWSTNIGYRYDTKGSGKAQDHPVYSVTWYDCVKWCNARSQKANLVPVYYTDIAMTNVYKTGQKVPYVKASANGYRLPTSAQWQYAARGGLASRRYSWGDIDTIQHSRANYFSDSSCSYDTSPTQGYHPSFMTSNAPYTSPVGSFLPNEFGLYDMVGNVYEWCFDQDTTYYADGRVIKGGSWSGGASACRVGVRTSGYTPPAYYSNTIGFRTILPIGN